MDSPYTTRKPDAAAGRAARQRVEVPLFGLARRLAHRTNAVWHVNGTATPTAVLAEGLVGFDSRRQRTEHSWHRPMCHALTRTTYVTRPSRDVPEGASCMVGVGLGKLRKGENELSMKKEYF
jgi:hypothetical protein